MSESGSSEVRKERSEGTLRFRYRFRAKVLYVSDIGSERRYSTKKI